MDELGEPGEPSELGEPVAWARRRGWALGLLSEIPGRMQMSEAGIEV